MNNQRFYKWLFPRITVPVYFAYFESILCIRCTRRVCSLSEKLKISAVGSSEPLRLNGRVCAIPIHIKSKDSTHYQPAYSWLSMSYIPYIYTWHNFLRIAPCVLTALTGIEIENETIPNNNGVLYNIFWDPPSCDVDSYTIYFTTQQIVHQCNVTSLDHDATNYHYNSTGLNEIQIAAHLNDITSCSKGMLSCSNLRSCRT